MIALWIFIIITLLLIVKVSIDIKESFLPEYLSHKSKSFDSEREMINRYGENAAWMANPTKSFDSEIDGVRQAGGDISGGFLGKTMKYY